MKIEQKALVGALANADRVAPRNSNVEIARCAVMSASVGLLTIRVTDYTLWLTMELPCEGDLPETAVHAARLLEVVGAMRDGALSFSVADGQLTIKGHGRAKRVVPTVSPDAFPSLAPLDDTRQIGMEAAAFRDGVTFVRPFVSDAASTPALCGVHMHEVHGAVRVAAAFRAGAMCADVGASLETFAATMPTAFVDALMRAMPVDGPFFIVTSERAVEASWSGGALRSPLLEAGFPNYEKAMPTHDGKRLRVNADELVSAIASARSFGHDDKAGGS